MHKADVCIFKVSADPTLGDTYVYMASQWCRAGAVAKPCV